MSSRAGRRCKSFLWYSPFVNASEPSSNESVSATVWVEGGFFTDQVALSSVSLTLSGVAAVYSS